MCGICGVVNGGGADPVNPAVLKQMSAVLGHRGPDSDGLITTASAGLAIRRLAVIDVAGGNQPMANEDETVWVVLNGEIYNYRELRAALEARGHRLRTHSDTEVIVHLYEEHGPECVQHLRGMFAFAVWDSQAQALLLARDRFGKKPLYYALVGNTLVFGSEIKSLLQYPGIPWQVDLEAIHHYLTLQYVPDPWTAFKGISKLPPAHRLLWRDSGFRVERYWDLAFEPKWAASEAELKEQVRSTLAEAVRIRLRSDVPLGAHLSGGVDSAIVVGLMAGMSDAPVKTFSIGFRETAYSELPYARQIAQRFATEHHEFILEPELVEVLPQLAQHFDEPFADPAAVPTWHLAKITREQVTVALNGDGGDEAFAGYQRYFADPVADAYRAVPAALRHNLFNPMLERLPLQLQQPMERSPWRALRQVARAAEIDRAASILRWGGYFDEAQKRTLYNDDMRQATQGLDTASLLVVSFVQAPARNRLDRTLYTDVQHYLPGALLTKVDRTTMAHSLEARSPFLDHQVIEFAARLPASAKVRGVRTKRLLRRAFADILPPEIAARGKQGFDVPLGLWFRGPLREAAGDWLLAPDARLRAYMRISEVRRLLDAHCQGRSDHGKRLWALINLELWLRLYHPS